MSPTTVPTRITIDFRDSVHPSRTWILGLEREPLVRVDLIAFEAAEAALAAMTHPPTLGALPGPRPTAPSTVSALSADCACPEFCERDHANE
jgi:hypothetical protein